MYGVYTRAVLSIEFWFRVLDTDDDGLLSLFELEYFYEEQYRRLMQQGYEPIPFTDTVCQVRSRLAESRCNARARLPHASFTESHNLLLHYSYKVHRTAHWHWHCTQMLDMVKPERKTAISLMDVKRERTMCDVFFDAFVNVDKYLEHEGADPFSVVKVPLASRLLRLRSDFSTH